MKSILVKLGVVLIIGLFIFVYAEVWGADWKLFFVTEEELFFFDTSSITHPSKNVIRVCIRQNFTKKGVMDCVGHLGKKYEKLSYLINLAEINCLEKTIRSLSLTYYDNKEGVIYLSSSPKELDFIVPESMVDGLYKEVCK